MTGFALQRHALSFGARLVGVTLTGIAACPIATPAQAQLVYTTVDFGTSGTFLTGIRGNNIVGNYVIPGGTGGLLYDIATATFTPFPVATESGANFPGAIGSSPYGPSFGSQFGILRTVGSYKTEASTPFDLSYLYDAAAAPGEQLTTLVYPDAPGATTLSTIAHSTFGNQAVGNYDTQTVTGNAFIYNIRDGTYATNNKPGAISTTAYGVWGDRIAGGYFMAAPGGGPAFEHGYIYNQTTGTWTTYDHPGAVFTHFEGITGAGRVGEYNLVVDWIDIHGQLHASVLHIGQNGEQTWIELDIPGAILVSANSVYADQVIGIYVDAGGGTHGYLVTIPGIYNPIRNLGTLVMGTPDLPALSGGEGDDVVNDGVIRTTGARSAGIRSDTYGVVTNNGLISVTGAGSAAVEMHGSYGSLLNGGILEAAPGADAIRTGPTAVGTLVVNSGIIDGRVAVTSGADGRFENSGWMGISAAGAGTTHVIDGTFAQTSAGVLVLRVGADSNDALQVNGAARLAGTEVSVFQPGALRNFYTILTATGGRTGTFDTFVPIGLPSFVTASLGYTPTDVTLSVVSGMAQVAGLSANQAAVGGALDNVFNLDGSLGGLGAIYGLSESGLPVALGLLSGEVHASVQCVLLNQALFSRQAVLGRLRQISYTGRSGPEAALGYAGSAAVTGHDASDPGLASAYAGGSRRAAAPAFPIKAPQQVSSTFWAQGFGAWGSINATDNASRVSGTFAGVISGADMRLAGDWRVGVALGYSQSDTDVDALANAARVETGLIAGYAGTNLGAWNVRAGATYGLSDIDTTRSIVFPGFNERVTADYLAGTGQVFGEVGYGTAWGALALEPFAGLAWAHLDTRRFTELGGAAALSGAGNASDIGYSSLGIRAASNHLLWNGMTLTPRAAVAWQHAFGEVSPVASLAFAGMGASFSVTGVPLARDAALVEAGADLRLGPQARIGISYSAQLATHARENAVKGSFAWNF